ncbi:hypothetical protein [Gracilibacillus thailandensis]|uniref:Uncharacterized protein n=1 Tax=Gracilibacillus thailandensis TaxID=563735 RepID=A0A6N7QZP3_9BACI|nr:hypothetical protein [Gracilibacillus thailandensis]MRI66200.1 hypothetical protein [Gracilibacillus thailandensis]
MANLRRVEEYRGTFTASLSTLRDMEDANYQAFTSLYRQYRDSNVVENLLTGIGGAALGIIFALAPVKPPIVGKKKDIFHKIIMKSNLNWKVIRD